MVINHCLLSSKGKSGGLLNAKIILFGYASELYKELEAHGITDRLKKVNQLGLIYVPRKNCKSRYDYAMLQLYFHQLIKNESAKESREEPGLILRQTYNNKVTPEEFIYSLDGFNDERIPSTYEILQMLTLISNMGHFYNTFTSSRAVVMLAGEDKAFYRKLLQGSQKKRFKDAVEKIIHERNYHRLHLLNSYLVLEKCDRSKPFIALALGILHSYLFQEELLPGSKLHYIFDLYRKVRNVAYISYDLHIAKPPFVIELWENKRMGYLFREFLSEHNDQSAATELINAIIKMLNDTVYNENSNIVCYYRISRKMVRLLKGDPDLYKKDYYEELWKDEESLLNKQYIRSRDYLDGQMLKLTFSEDETQIALALLEKLEYTQNIRVGSYDRPGSGSMTIVVSLTKRCDKPAAAIRVLRLVVNELQKIEGIKPSDKRYLLVAKFFLYFVFNEHNIMIKETIDQEVCVLCARGRRKRMQEIEALLKKGHGTADQRHETNCLISYLKKDRKNDVTIIIPASILFYKKEERRKTLCEFDGMIIFPNRKFDQIVLSEAKNKYRKPVEAIKNLQAKLEKIGLKDRANNVRNTRKGVCDAITELTINSNKDT